MSKIFKVVNTVRFCCVVKRLIHKIASSGNGLFKQRFDEVKMEGKDKIEKIEEKPLSPNIK
jgi:hypothetical protein